MPVPAIPRRLSSSAPPNGTLGYRTTSYDACAETAGIDPGWHEIEGSRIL